MGRTPSQKQQMANSSSVSEFLLLAFADTRELQLLHFALFLGIYLAALLGNGLILTAVACDYRLHTPMYFFLLNLALLDLGCISTTLPKAMANALWDTRAISYQGCAAQVFLLFFFIGAEYFLLTVMAYDRYTAICKPLHYGSLILRVVLRMPSEQGRHKAFSTCLPHLAVISLMVSTGISAYLKPPSISSPSRDLVVSFLYSVVPPAVNPLIYSLRNQELRDSNGSEPQSDR
ncbi:olfactory receptor 14C36-like [Anser cygnoides]|uniref:olfactory receptor 14C36-like n=1 Tax=Anser cygnoides TaxID=8845 RepID=UPI0034D34B85